MKMKQLLVVMLCVLSFFGNAQDWEKVDLGDGKKGSEYLADIEYDSIREAYYGVGVDGIYHSQDLIKWDLLNLFGKRVAELASAGKYYFELFTPIDDEMYVFDKEKQKSFLINLSEFKEVQSVYLTGNQLIIVQFDEDSSGVKLYIDSNPSEIISIDDTVTVSGQFKGDESPVFYSIQGHWMYDYYKLNEVFLYEGSSGLPVDTLSQRLRLFRFDTELMSIGREYLSSGMERVTLNQYDFKNYSWNKYLVDTLRPRSTTSVQVYGKDYYYAESGSGTEDTVSLYKFNEDFLNISKEEYWIENEGGASLEQIINDSLLYIHSYLRPYLYNINAGTKVKMEIDSYQSGYSKYYISDYGVVIEDEGREFLVGEDILEMNIYDSLGYVFAKSENNEEFLIDKYFGWYGADTIKYYLNMKTKDYYSINIKNDYSSCQDKLQNEVFYEYNTNSDSLFVSSFNMRTKEVSRKSIYVSDSNVSCEKRFTGPTTILMLSERGKRGYSFLVEDVKLKTWKKSPTLDVDYIKQQYIQRVKVDGDSIEVWFEGESQLEKKYEVYTSTLREDDKWIYNTRVNSVSTSQVSYKGELFEVVNLRLIKTDSNDVIEEVFIDNGTSWALQIFVYGNNLYVSTIQGLYKYNSTIDGTFSFQKVEEKNYVYPNPSTGKLSLDKSKLEGVSEYSLYDLAGNKIEKGNVGADELNLSAEPGMYILNLVGDDKVYSQKIIIE